MTQAVAIVGEVGSGKSTLLKGMLGEAPVFLGGDFVGADIAAERGISRGACLSDGQTTSAIRRVDRVCYAAQTPWVMSGTVRDNVLFGLPMNEKAYRFFFFANWWRRH